MFSVTGTWCAPHSEKHISLIRYRFPTGLESPGNPGKIKLNKNCVLVPFVKTQTIPTIKLLLYSTSVTTFYVHTCNVL